MTKEEDQPAVFFSHTKLVPAIRYYKQSTVFFYNKSASHAAERSESFSQGRAAHGGEENRRAQNITKAPAQVLLGLGAAAPGHGPRDTSEQKPKARPPPDARHDVVSR